MPELPEVETVRKSLIKQVKQKTIKKVKVFYPSIIKNDLPTFEKNIQNKTIFDIQRRGKWLLFDLGEFVLCSHLRMEGKYFLKKQEEKKEKHEHVIFYLEDGMTLRYHDTRKFGRMCLVRKEEMENVFPLNELGLEPWDEKLTSTYLKEKYKNKTLPIKTVLLDQKIIVGIGNIYADEILFLSQIHPERQACTLKKKELEKIVQNTRTILEKAIHLGGTTIKSYMDSEGIHGRFQNELLIHTKQICPQCGGKVKKIRVGGRGTYYCPICQKEKKFQKTSV